MEKRQAVQSPKVYYDPIDLLHGQNKIINIIHTFTRACSKREITSASKIEFCIILASYLENTEL